MGPGEYAAEVDEGDQTTHHRVLLSDDLLAELAPGEQAAEQDGQRVVEQALHYLLERMPNTSLEHDVDLADLRSSDGEFVEELRSRL